MDKIYLTPDGRLVLVLSPPIPGPAPGRASESSWPRGRPSDLGPETIMQAYRLNGA